MPRSADVPLRGPERRRAAEAAADVRRAGGSRRGGKQVLGMARDTVYRLIRKVSCALQAGGTLDCGPASRDYVDQHIARDRDGSRQTARCRRAFTDAYLPVLAERRRIPFSTPMSSPGGKRSRPARIRAAGRLVREGVIYVDQGQRGVLIKLVGAPCSWPGCVPARAITATAGRRAWRDGVWRAAPRIGKHRP